MNLSTWLYTKLCGKLVGEDQFGNCYYETEKPMRFFGRKNRWVCYNGTPEPSKIPAQWFSWMHYQTDTPPADNNKLYDWQLEHTPNFTGTRQAFMPSGHLKAKGKRDKAVGDYQPWRG